MKRVYYVYNSGGKWSEVVSFHEGGKKHVYW